MPVEELEMGYQPKYGFDGKKRVDPPMTRRERIELAILLVVLAVVAADFVWGLSLVMQELASAK
jgi:hypothetical protein